MKSAIKIALGVVVTLVIMAALITTIVVTTTTNYEDRCKTATVPSSLHVDKIDECFEIWWYVPSANGGCNVIYLLQYNIAGGPAFKVNVTDDNYILENVNLEACATLQLQMWAISETGNITESSITRYYTDIPRGTFTDPQFTDVSEGLLVTWIKPVELTTCNVRYNFSMMSELGSFTRVSDTEGIIVPFDIYCFRGTINLDAIVEDSNRASIVYIYRESMRRIPEIQFRVSSDDPTELIVTWNNHLKEKMCSIIYDVYFFTEEIEPEFSSVTIPEARFNFIHCNGSVVDIMTFGLNRTTEGPYGSSETPECE